MRGLELGVRLEEEEGGVRGKHHQGPATTYLSRAETQGPLMCLETRPSLEETLVRHMPSRP